MNNQQVVVARPQKERLANLLGDVLENPEVTLGEVANTSSAIINFAGDLMGCPVNPAFWEGVNEILAKHPGTIQQRKGIVGTESLRNMLAMSDGDISVFELREVGVVFRETYRALMETVSEVADGPPPQRWANDLLKQLSQGRL